LKTNLISKSETNQIIKLVSDQWKRELPKIKNLKVHFIDNNSQLMVGDGIIILKIDDDYLPFLNQSNILEKFPNVMVDMGAVKFMCNGANVMRPGIKKYTEFVKGDIICVIEESQHKFLAVGKAITDSSELENISKGEIIKNLHYISDKYWEIAKTI
jgi:PUA domain protein|tara:strand:- start:870 stop:1340 length:471 start_codon:yes stop_codon:yes gene_type:complete